MTAVLVAIPAHDEEPELAICLRHLRAAVVRALATADPPTIVVSLAAHRCVDDTFAIARGILAGFPVRALVTRDALSGSVGDVRRRLVYLARAHVDERVEATWLLNTDADSRVPPDWIVETVRVAESTGVVAVAGMVQLHGWQPPPTLRLRYARLIEAKIDESGHGHVYGANLAVRLDAYDRAGGFRGVLGEDQDLVDRVRAGGEPVLSTFAPLVSTSARTPGRADGGLGTLLQRLSEEDRAAPVVARAVVAQAVHHGGLGHRRR